MVFNTIFTPDFMTSMIFKIFRFIYVWTLVVFLSFYTSLKALRRWLMWHSHSLMFSSENGKKAEEKYKLLKEKKFGRVDSQFES